MLKPQLTPLVLLIIFIISNCSATNAQIRLNAQDKLIRYDLIRPSHTLYKAIFFDKSGKVTRELVIDHTTQVDTIKKEIAFINSVPYAPGKLMVDTSMDNYSGSLRYTLATFPDTKSEFIKYLPTSVEAKNVINGINSNKTTQMPIGYFDDNSIWDILGIIPFKKGISYQLNCYGTDTHTQVLIPYTVEYLLDEEIQNADGGFSDNMVLKVSYDGTIAFVWANKITHLMTKEFVQGKDYSFTRITI